MHQNSIDAFNELGIHLSRRELEVLGVYEKYPRQAFTDRGIMITSHYFDMNKVRPRISELLRKGLLVELVPKIVDPMTGRRVRLCKYNPPHPEAADG